MGETTEKYPIPEIRKDGRISTLYVKGEPLSAGILQIIMIQRIKY